MKEEVYYYCKTCKKRLKDPDEHNKETDGKHNIRIKGQFIVKNIGFGEKE
jgi:predicted HicB family RNase H-like nuclease